MAAYRQPGRGDGTKKAGMTLKVFKRSFAGIEDHPEVDNRWGRIDEKAERRGERLARQLLGKVDAARDALAAAEADVRCAKGPDKAAARRARRDREQDLKRAKNAARKAGLNP